MNWLKMSADFDHHPQVLEAGWHGARLFELLLRISRKFRLEGIIPPKYLDPKFLLRFWGAPDDFPFGTAKRALVSAGLVTETESGIVIDGWKRWCSSDYSTERVRRFRERVTGKKRSETGGNQEEKRGEEKRVEEEPVSPSGDAHAQVGFSLAVDEPPGPKRSDCDALVDLWNTTAHPDMPRCQKMTPGRRTKAKALLKVVPLEDWPKLIAQANASSFCRGATGFRLSLAWMLKSPENALKVLEGTYNDKPRQPSYGDVNKLHADVPQEKMSDERFAQLFGRKPSHG